MISERVFAQGFHFFWKELLPFLTPHYITLFNEAYSTVLQDTDGNPLLELEIPEAVDRPDVAAELAFRLAKISCDHNVAPEDNSNIRPLIPKAIQEVQISFRTFAPAGSIVEPTAVEIDEALLLCSRYGALYREKIGNLVYCPRVQGVGFIDSCEADLGIDDTLVEVKTTTRRVSGRDLRQVLVYLALRSAQGDHHWSAFGVFNPRRGILSSMSVQAFVAHVSGGKTVHDVYNEILSFSASRDLLIEKEF